MVSLLFMKGALARIKTLLSSSIIGNSPSQILHLELHTSSLTEGMAKQNYSFTTSSFDPLFQLSDTRHGGIPPELADLYKNCGVLQPLDDQLQDTLRDVLNGFSDAYIVIDALDECTDRNSALNWVKTLLADTDHKARNLHIVITSRPEPDIEENFEALHPDLIDVGKAVSNKDILKYLELQMESKFKKYDENTRNKIKLGLAKRSDGSYVCPRSIQLRLIRSKVSMGCIAACRVREMCEHK